MPAGNKIGFENYTLKKGKYLGVKINNLKNSNQQKSTTPKPPA
jgi:hypothetical protein